MSLMYNGTFLTNSQHSPTEESVLMALNRFGCMALEQIQYFVPPFTTLRENYIFSICRHLRNSRQANTIDNNYLVPANVNVPDENTVLSIWVYIDLLKDKQKIYSFYRNCPMPKYPCAASFIRDNEVLVSIIPILTEQDLSKIYAESENYAKYDTAIGLKREYVLAINDISLVDKIPSFNPAFPFKIAYAEGEFTTQMKVTYYTLE